MGGGNTAHDVTMHAIFFNPPLEKNYLGYQMAEVYKDGIYEPLLKGKKDLTILDIGANIGVTSYYFSKFAKIVYALEPATEHFQIFAKMIKFNGIENVKLIKKAIGLKNEIAPLFSNSGNRTANSLNPSVKDKGEDVEPENVEVITIDKLFKDEKIEHVDFMKLDIEGTETEVISSAGFREVAPKIDSILLETHFWSGRHPNQIKDALKQHGFKLSYPENTADLIVGIK